MSISQGQKRARHVNITEDLFLIDFIQEALDWESNERVRSILEKKDKSYPKYH